MSLMEWISSTILFQPLPPVSISILLEVNSKSRAFDFFFINAGMTQTVEDPRLATGGWLDLTRQAFHLLDYSPLSGRTILNG